MPVIRQLDPPHLALPGNPLVGEAYARLTDAVIKLEPASKILRLYVEYALARFDGNVTRAADGINVHRRTIQRWREDWRDQAPKDDGIRRRVRPTGT